MKAIASDRSKNVDVRGFAIPVAIFAGLVVAISIFTRWGIAAAVLFWFLMMTGLLAWSRQQLRRAREEIRAEIEQRGYKVIKMNYRSLRLGPFSLWDTSRSQHVYRVVVQEGGGRERIVWARGGRRGFWDPHTLEFRWEDEASPK